jgi:transglutaminase-like putative cysteine protease
MPAVRYHVLHETRYDYGSPVSLSQQQLHLSPRVLDWQQVEEQCISIEPPPTWRRDGQDAFGNPVTWVAFHVPHDSLVIRSVMTIAVAPHLPGDLDDSLAWEEVRDRLAYDATDPRRKISVPPVSCSKARTSASSTSWRLTPPIAFRRERRSWSVPSD